MNANGQVPVWDRFVRLFHWALAAGFFTAYLVEDELMGLHVWAGYLIGALVLIRVLWGIIGPRHARFADFVPGPARFTAYLGELIHGRERRYLGHNPAGGAMIVALLLALMATVTTGLMVYGAEEKAGPLADWYAADNRSPALPGIAPAHADAGEAHEGGEGHEEEAETLEELHEFFANFTLLLVVLHVAGVVFASRREGQNLARAMVTGRKRAPHGDGPA